jgi:hypothetical protein
VSADDDDDAGSACDCDDCDDCDADFALWLVVFEMFCGSSGSCEADCRMFRVDDEHDGLHVSLAFLFFPIIILLSIMRSFPQIRKVCFRRRKFKGKACKG